MYCVKCGKEEEIYSKLCRECLVKDKKLAGFPDYITRLVCPDCRSYRIGMVWMDEFDGPQSLIDNNLKLDESVTESIIDYPEFPDGNNEFEIYLEAELTIGEVRIEYPMKFRLRTRFQICDTCSRKKGGYFEAIIQIRGDSRDIGAEKLETIAGHIISGIEANSSDKFSFLTKEEDVKGGKDFYLGSSQVARNIVKNLQNRYGGKITESSSLFGMKDGKDIYRHTFLLRLPKLLDRDIVGNGRHFFIVESVTKKYAILKNLANWEKRKIGYDDFKNFSVNHDAGIGKAVIVHDTEDEIQVLHPRSMKSVTVKKPKDYSSSGEEVEVAFFDDEIFLI